MTMIDKQTREERRRQQREGVAGLEASGALDDLYAKIDAGQVQLGGKVNRPGFSGGRVLPASADAGR